MRVEAAGTATAGVAYDPEARRDTPLALELRARIRAEGPITVEDYVRACLLDEAHGYYTTKAAIGAAGDFVTAPEISQVFGELIGLWSVVVWQQMGTPARVNLVEIGPGRGTLLRDALRATRRVPGLALDVHLVETSAAMRRRQAQALATAGVAATWHAHLTRVPPAPSIVIANELLDALPVEQYVRVDIGWRRRMVGLDAADRLVFGHERDGRTYFPRAAPLGPGPVLGAIVEQRTTMDLAFGLARLAQAGPVAALFVDYGHRDPAVGDTLQAVRGHRYEHPLTSPGEADLTTQVDFASFRDAAGSFELAVDGPVTQAEFLGALGIMERASRLMAANPTRAGEIEAGVARLMSPSGMGTRFLAVGIRSRDLPPLPGFPTVDIRPPPP